MKIANAEWLSWPETKALIQAFNGLFVRFVGGAVRDSLLGIPVKDVDLATNIPPAQVMKILAQSGIKTVPTGIEHGTVTAVIARRHFEITTLRRDVSTDGRRAVVAYTNDLHEDAARRDFTMNALYLDAEGEITDYWGGYEDTLSGRVRFIGKPEERISEDALRILRFFRFLAFYGREPADKEALAACTSLAAKIETLSGERIQQEMLKLLAAEKSADIISLMQASNILHYVIPKTVSMESLAKLPGVLQETGTLPDAIIALALLLRSTDKNISELIDFIYTRWKLSRANYHRLSDLCQSSRMDINKTDEKLWKKQIRHLGKHDFIAHVIIAMAEGSNNEAGLQAINLVSRWQIPTFPLTGNDLIMHGVKPGKEMGLLLERLERYWEEKDYAPGKEELMKTLST